MKFLRYALGALVALYALFKLFPVIVTDVAWKVGLGESTGDAARLVPLWRATNWLHVILWLTVVGLFLVAAWRLIRGGRAFLFYVAAVALEMLLWATIKTLPIYRYLFTSLDHQMDYYTVAAMVVVGALIWFSERYPTAPAAS